MRGIVGFGLGCLLVGGMLLMDRGRVLAQMREPATNEPSAQGSPPVAEPAPIPPVLSQPALFPISLGAGIGDVFNGFTQGVFNGFTQGELGGFGAFGGLAFFAPRVNYTAVWYADQPILGPNTGLGMARQDSATSMPVWQDQPNAVQGPPGLGPPPGEELPAPEPAPVPLVPSPPGPFPISLGSGIGGGVGMSSYGGFAPGQIGGSGAFGGPGVFAPRVSYAAVWYPSQPVTGQNTGLGMERQDMAFSMPVWHAGPNTLMITSNVRSLLYQTNAVLPDSGRQFPSDLWNIGAGVNYMRQFQNGWMMTTMVNVGSSSDQPFAAWRDLNVSLGGFVRMPSGERNAWMFGAMYSPTAEVPFPIPIASYYWQPNNQFSMNVGMPFSMRWRPLRNLQFDVAYVPVRTVHTRVTYRVLPRMGIYAGFDWNNESYFLADRTTINERFFYYEKRVTLGCRYTVSPRAAFDLSGGYAFDRFFFTGEQWSDQNHDRVDVGDGPFLALRFQVRF